MKNIIIIVFLLFFASSCNHPDKRRTISVDRIDIHSYATPEEAVITHLSLNLNVDFDRQVLSGKARYSIKHKAADRIILDSKNLNIEKVTLGEEEAETAFDLGKEQLHLGQSLTISIMPETEIITIYYSTNPDSEALQWLNPQQTADKTHPFLFTQGQAILTRTWIPIQDSPGIRFSYDATIAVPNDLLAVMSAENPQKKNNTGIYNFKMTQPIPAYLMALAVGNLTFKPISDRTGVYASPNTLEAALYEFGEIEKMVSLAENLYGKYQWERFDLLVLPPSFPFGGMENPRLTFVTPTIIAGDRSLTSLIAHELAHSWSGNLVTNATWNDFWLNEGFTTYFERRIMEELYGANYSNMLSILGKQDLEAAVRNLDERDTHLYLDLKNRNPDDGMEDIAYEKGAYFLKMLEQEVGRTEFDAFIATYFKKYAFQSMTTDEFTTYLNENLIQKFELNIDIDEWIHTSGIPDNCPFVESDKFGKVNDQLGLVKAGGFGKQMVTTDWSTLEWLHFIRHLPTNIEQEVFNDLEQTFNFSKSGNAEILAAWFELSILSKNSATNLNDIENFLINVGRRKFLTPLYSAFVKTEQIETAQQIYTKARPNYHSISTQTIDELLKIKN